IPKFADIGYLRTEEVEALHHILYSSVPSKNKGNPWSFLVKNQSHMKTNLIFNRYIGLRCMCFSSNLHFNDNSEPDKLIISSSPLERREFLDHFVLIMQANESLFYQQLPVVVFSVHSPFIQNNPIFVANVLKLGHEYEVNVRLEEEHLLPHPFPTNCTDYDEMWRKNNKTGPRSQEACQKKCLESFEEQCWEYASARMLSFGNNDNPICEKIELEEIPRCEMNCKNNCLDTIKITAFLETTEVNVMKHNALYSKEELFSYIGGLMGCWLGISVWASVGIFENAIRKIVQAKRLFRKN
ncbi:uncharacterized protein NPIL_405941, partial [Nephila pilipes]